MEITVKKIDISRLQEALAVESAAMSGGWYLEDVRELFFGDNIGAMLGAEVDGKLVGISKYTILPDGTAWLEVLRVHPDYQRKGVGRKIYEEFVRRSKELKIPSMAMYTGATNIPSAGLARQFGLETAGLYREFALDIKNMQSPADTADFKPVDETKAIELLNTLKEGWGGFVIFNRTFMHMNDKIFASLAKEGKVYLDEKSGSFMAFGNRFLPKRSVQIALMGGDLQKCMDFAVAKGIEKAVPQVITIFPPTREDLQKTVQDYGFVKTSDLQVMQGDVK